MATDNVTRVTKNLSCHPQREGAPSYTASLADLVLEPKASVLFQNSSHLMMLSQAGTRGGLLVAG